MRKIVMVDICLKEQLRSVFYEYLKELSTYDKTIKFDKNNNPIYKYYNCYFTDKDRYPIYLEIDNNIAGFALVRKVSCYKYEIGEFYICHEYRKDGNALFFANAIINMFKGDFTFSTKINNVRAVRFWEKVVGSFNSVNSFDSDDTRYWELKDESIKKHSLGLQEVYFEMVKNGSKIYEGRLNDEKRKSMNIGDVITFLKDPSREESFNAVITNKFTFKSFKDMVENLELNKLGFNEESKEEIVSIYHQFYSLEDEEKYGVVALEVGVI